MNHSNPHDLTIGDLALALKQNRKIVFGLPLLALLLAITFLHVADDMYTVVLKVTPTSSSGGAMPSRIGSLANLAGLSLPSGQEANTFKLYLEGIRSREAAAEIATNPSLMRRLFANEWSEEHGSWQVPSGVFSWLKSVGKAVIGAYNEPWRVPDALRVAEYIEAEVLIARDSGSPVVRLSIVHKDPVLARDMLSALHAAVDPALRKKELERTSVYIDYLQRKLRSVIVAEYRQALNDIIVEQEKRRMVASSDLAFAAEPLGAPAASIRPTSPRPGLVIILSLMLGIFAAVVIAFARNQLRASG